MLRKLLNSIRCAVFCALVLTTVGLALHALAPLSPIITIFFVMCGTICALGRTLTTIMSIAGILLYASSWYIAGTQGVVIGNAVCCLGILLWFSALILSFTIPMPKRQTI